MQDQPIPSDFDPWDAWLTDPASQVSLPEMLDGQQSESGVFEESDWDAGRQAHGESNLSEPAEMEGNEWKVPTVEELESFIKGMDCEQSQDLRQAVVDPEVSIGNDRQNTDQLETTPKLSALQPDETSHPEDRADWETDCEMAEGQQSLDFIDDDLRMAFLDDANACMGAMEAAALQLEQDKNPHDATIQFCRQLHTLKGAAASVGLKGLAGFLHDCEELIRLDQQAGRTTSSEVLLEKLDWVQSQLAGLRNPSPGVVVPNPVPLVTDAEYQSQFSGHSESLVRESGEVFTIESADDDDSVRVKTSQINRLMDLVAGLVMLRNRRQTEITDLREIYYELSGVVTKLKLFGNLHTKQIDREREPGNEFSTRDSQPDRSTATFGGSLQLTELAADVQETAQRLRDCNRPVAEGNEAVSQFIRQFRQELVELKKAPVASLFQRLQRAVRDAGRAESKSVQLEGVGAHVSVERSLQQRLFEPLLHIVRNAVCHGIERPELRQAAGKSEVGLIIVEVTSAADLLTIEIRDDGAGLNYPAIRQKAVERGLLAKDYNPTEQELAQFIFHPGFSTRQTANQQAGRGIGMDIVATTLNRLGGWIDIASVAGFGTTLRLNVPLRSAIDHLMVFRCGSQHYALPLLAVRSAGEIDLNSPSAPLAALLTNGLCQDEAARASLLIELGNMSDRSDTGQSSHLNLLVDEIVGPEEVVIRPLPNLLRSHPYCSGATLGSAGQTVLVLEPRKLLAWVSRQGLIQPLGNHPVKRNASGAHGATTPQSNKLPVNAVESSGEPVVLVVDDSLSSRKAVVRSLSRYPLRVVEASDGRQALQLLRSNRFAAIFSDLEMPHVDGIEFLTEVRSLDTQQKTPFTIISSRQEDEFKSRAEALGVTRYLAKPINDAAVDSVLEEISLLVH